MRCEAAAWALSQSCGRSGEARIRSADRTRPRPRAKYHMAPVVRRGSVRKLVACRTSSL